MLALLTFPGRDNHDHLPPFHFRHLFDDTQLIQISRHPFQQVETQFLMGKFTPTVTQGYFHLVAAFQKLPEFSDLGLVVAFLGTRTELDFLDLNLLLLFLSSLLLLVGFEFIFAVIHDSANGRLCIRRHFDQIKSRLLRHGKGFGCFYYTDLVSFGINDPYLGVSNILISTVLFFCSDILILQNSKTAVRDSSGQTVREVLEGHGTQVFTVS